jgi:positive regulator of sigma E activity
MATNEGRHVPAGSPSAMAFALYFVGFIVFIAGLAALATALGVSEAIVTGAAFVLIALGLFAGILRRRARDARAPV